MKAPRKPESIAAGLSVPEQILLFCLASGTDWQKAAVTGAAKAPLKCQAVWHKLNIERMCYAPQFLSVPSAPVLVPPSNC